MDGRLGAIVRAPLRMAAQVGDAIVAGGQMIFRATRSAWSFVYARTRFDFRNDVGDPLDNSIISALIGWLARNFPEAPVRVHRLAPDGTTMPILSAMTGPGAMLRLLERPNKYYSGIVQWMATIVDYIVGNAYWLKVRNASGRVEALWWLPAWMVEPKWDEKDPSSFIGWYAYTVDTVTYKLDPRDVIHFRNGLDPKNVRKGLGRLGSLWRELFTDNEAAAMTASLMRNLGVPGVIIAPANTQQGPLRFNAEAVKSKFDETFGNDGRGGTMVLTRPTEVKVLSWSPEQMNLRELRRIPEERAAAVIGIPAGVAGLGAGLDRNTFSNYGEANVAAYTQGVIPLHRLIAADLEVQLLDEFADLDEGYDVDFDWTQVKAMAAFFDAVWKRAEGSAIKGLITRATYRRMTGQPVAADGSDDVFIYPNNYIVEPANRLIPAGGQPSPPAAGNGRAHHPELDLELALETPGEQPSARDFFEAMRDSHQAFNTMAAATAGRPIVVESPDVTVEPTQVTFEQGAVRVDNHVTPAPVTIEKGAVQVDVAVPAAKATKRTVERDRQGRITALTEAPDGS